MRHLIGSSVVRGLVACFVSVVALNARADEQTVINESLFSLSLPGKWRGSYDKQSDSWQYRSADGREAVTVGVLRRNAGSNPQAIKADFEINLRARRESEVNLNGRKVRLTEPEVHQRGVAVLAHYSGVDAPNGRRTLTRVIVNEVVAGSFYYEGLDFSATVFEARAKIVLAKIRLIDK